MSSQSDFTLFGTAHLGALLVVTALTALLVLMCRRALSGGLRRIICMLLAGVLIGGMIFEQSYELATGLWSLEHSLPLHLCDLAVFALVPVLLGAEGRSGQSARQHASWRQALYELAWYWGVGGTIPALLTPDLWFAPPHPKFFTFFLQHGTVVLSAIVLTIGLGMRPRPGSLLRVWLVTHGIAAVVLVVNIFASANYMFLCAAPAMTTPLSYMGRWPWSILTLEVEALILMSLCYVPWISKSE